MPLTPVDCPNCGGHAQLNSDLKTAICPYCGATILVEEAHNLYETRVNIEHLHADTVNITGASTADERLKSAEALLRLKNYTQAFDVFSSITNEKAQDYRLWKGLIVAYTYDFTRRIISESRELMKMDYYINAFETMSESYSERKDFLSRCNKYITTQRQMNESEKKEICSKIDDLELRKEELSKKRDSLGEDWKKASENLTCFSKEAKETESKLKIKLDNARSIGDDTVFFRGLTIVSIIGLLVIGLLIVLGTVFISPIISMIFIVLFIICIILSIFHLIIRKIKRAHAEKAYASTKAINENIYGSFNSEIDDYSNKIRQYGDEIHALSNDLENLKKELKKYS